MVFSFVCVFVGYCYFSSLLMV